MNQSANADAHTGFADIHQSQDVALQVEAGILYGSFHRDLRGLVTNHVRPDLSKDIRQSPTVHHIDGKQRNGRRQVVLASHREIVHHERVMPIREAMFDDVTPDKTRSARDQDFHGPPFSEYSKSVGKLHQTTWQFGSRSRSCRMVS